MARLNFEKCTRTHKRWSSPGQDVAINDFQLKWTPHIACGSPEWQTSQFDHWSIDTTLQLLADRSWASSCFSGERVVKILNNFCLLRLTTWPSRRVPPSPPLWGSQASLQPHESGAFKAHLKLEVIMPILFCRLVRFGVKNSAHWVQCEKLNSSLWDSKTRHTHTHIYLHACTHIHTQTQTYSCIHTHFY